MHFNYYYYYLKNDCFHTLKSSKANQSKCTFKTDYENQSLIKSIKLQNELKKNMHNLIFIQTYHQSKSKIDFKKSNLKNKKRNY